MGDRCQDQGREPPGIRGWACRRASNSHNRPSAVRRKVRAGMVPGWAGTAGAGAATAAGRKRPTIGPASSTSPGSASSRSRTR